MTRLSISAQFTVKDRETPGYRGSHWNFGKDKELSLSEMLWAVNFTILEQYLQFTDIKTLNQELDTFRKRFANVEVTLDESTV